MADVVVGFKTASLFQGSYELEEENGRRAEAKGSWWKVGVVAPPVDGFVINAR